MSPARSREPLAQRRLAILLREALARNDHDAAAALIREHPVGVRASHVRHNLSTELRARLDQMMTEENL